MPRITVYFDVTSPNGMSHTLSVTVPEDASGRTLAATVHLGFLDGLASTDGVITVPEDSDDFEAYSSGFRSGYSARTKRADRPSGTEGPTS